VTFNYPADWKQIENLDSPSRWGYGNPIVAFYKPIGNGSENEIELIFTLNKETWGRWMRCSAIIAVILQILGKQKFQSGISPLMG